MNLADSRRLQTGQPAGALLAWLGLVAAPERRDCRRPKAVLAVATWRELWPGRALSDGRLLCGEGAASVALWSPWREEPEGGGCLSGRGVGGC